MCDLAAPVYYYVYYYPSNATQISRRAVTKLPEYSVGYSSLAGSERPGVLMRSYWRWVYNVRIACLALLLATFFSRSFRCFTTNLSHAIIF